MILKQTFKKILAYFGLKPYLDFLLFYIRNNKNNPSDRIISDFYSNIIKPNDLVFDIGANIGNYTAIFSNLGAKVVCLEPQKYCYTFLKLRFKAKKNIVIIKKAVDNEEKKKEIFISEHHGVSSMSSEWINNVKKSGRFPTTSWDEKEIIETITLNQLITEYGVPRYCKIDVEGYEFNVLKGLKTKIPLISFEFSYENISVAINCINYLSSLGNIKINIILGNYMGYNLNEWMDKESFFNYLKNLKDKLTVADIFVKLT